MVREGLTKVTFKYKLLAVWFQVPQKGVICTLMPPSSDLRPLKARCPQFLAQIFVNFSCLRQRELQHPDLALKEVTTFQVKKQLREGLRTCLKCKQSGLGYRLTGNAA